MIEKTDNQITISAQNSSKGLKFEVIVMVEWGKEIFQDGGLTMILLQWWNQTGAVLYV